MVQITNRMIIFLCYLPYLYILAFYSYVFRAIIKLGKVLGYNEPDPKELGFTIHRKIIFGLFDIVVYGLMLLTIALVVNLIFKKLTVRKQHVMLLIAGVCFIVLHLLCDPFDKWFMD